MHSSTPSGRYLARWSLAMVLCGGCASHPEATDAGPADAGESAYAIAQTFDSHIAGLWSGAATQTVLGTFPLMNFDLRPASGNAMFGRVDLSAGNSLRFEFMIETFNGQDTLVYRNGGYFMNILRDTRTNLIDHDDAAGTYHFCAESGGCSFVDALWTFTDATHLTLDVHVNGSMHLLWEATRKEPRPLPSPFPANAESQGDGTAPFPALPELDATVTWSTPLAAAADVWVLLSTTACVSTTSCNVSRGISATAPEGATSASVSIQQLLPGTYNVLGVVDRNNDLDMTLAPAPGDSVSDPYSTVTVSGTGTQNVSLAATIDL